MEMADILVAEGYAKAGYTLISLDDCWLAKERGPQGQLQPDPERFPNGIRALSDYVSSLKESKRSNQRSKVIRHCFLLLLSLPEIKDPFQGLALWYLRGLWELHVRRFVLCPLINQLSPQCYLVGSLHSGYPGIINNMEQDAKTFAEWQVDYVKLDGCYAFPSQMDRGTHYYQD